MPAEQREAGAANIRANARQWRGYAFAVLAVAGLTAAALPLRSLLLPSSLIMLYLLIVALIARRYQRGPAILASVLSVAAFDFFFIKPHLTFAVEDVQYLLTFAIMLLVGVLISNLTGQLEAQVEARVASQSQIANEQLRNSLLSSISHDLRTPLAGISGSASTLLTLPPAGLVESGPPLLATIRDESDRLALLVNNILELTRLESGRVELQAEWLPLEEPIGAALTALEARVQGRLVTVDLPPDLPLVRADAVLLERLFANLIDNALRYAGVDSPVLVSAEADGAKVVVTVADRGPGLPSGGGLFEKFSRGAARGSTSLPGSSGMGLGLSICKAIVEAHGGSIWAAGRPGGGAEFGFSLPLGGAQPQVPAEPPGDSEVEGGPYGR